MKKELNIVINTKGGVGKSLISFNVLTLKYNIDNVEIYEIDNNNKTTLHNSKLQIKNLNLNKTEETIEEAIFNIFADKKNIIIDSGGGDDTKNLIKYIKRADIPFKINFYIPVLNDLEINKNIIDTLNLIQDIKDKKVYLVLNKVKDINEVEQEFFNLFGNKTYGINGILDEIKDKIDNIIIIEDSILFSIVKNIYKKTLLELNLEAEEVVKNINKIRQQLIKKGKEKYIEEMKYINLLKDINKLANKIKQQFKK